jgi:hypothetical protein
MSHKKPVARTLDMVHNGGMPDSVDPPLCKPGILGRIKVRQCSVDFLIGSPHLDHTAGHCWRRARSRCLRFENAHMNGACESTGAVYFICVALLPARIKCNKQHPLTRSSCWDRGLSARKQNKAGFQAAAVACIDKSLVLCKCFLAPSLLPKLEARPGYQAILLHAD